MKKNTMKMACNTALHNAIGSKPAQTAPVKNLGKIKIALIAVIGVLVIGFSALFVLA
jgi:hypothetical protein